MLTINEHEDSTHFYRDGDYGPGQRWNVQTFHAGSDHARLLVRFNCGDLSCGFDLTAEESVALAAALMKHAKQLQAPLEHSA